MSRSQFLPAFAGISVWIGCLTLGLNADGLNADESIEYNRDIRPILAENCFACHGPDSASRKGDLRLDQREAAVASAAIVEGQPAESAIIERIKSSDPDLVMPPPSAHKQITPAQFALLEKWIAAGAPYQPHWSYIAPEPQQPPEVKNQTWTKNPIDHFVLNRLESIGLAPAPEADRHTLARRAALDVTGLPPTPEMLDEFLGDTAPDAYEKYVERLLKSERWGEHRGRHWLDYARYADSHGIHFDNYREIWAYRDWVIQAFNQNMPFDQFTIEQLAGDLLPNPTLDQKIATGFNRCNITTNEGGVIPEEYAVLYTRDRLETTAAVWLGSTAGCAVCHDHKFDPLSLKETYSLAAFFNNTTQNPMDGNIKDTPPIIPVPLPEDRERWNLIDSEIGEAQNQLNMRRDAARADFQNWASTPDTLKQFRNYRAPNDALAFHLPLDDGEGKSLHFATENQIRTILLDKDTRWQTGVLATKAWENQNESVPEFNDVGDFERDRPYSLALWVKLANPKQGGSILARMNDTDGYRGWDVWLEQGKIGTHLVNSWPENAIKSITRDALPPNQWNHVVINYNGSSKADGIQIFVNGVRQAVAPSNNTLTETIHTPVPLKIGQRHSGDKTPGTGVQDLRIYNRELNEQEIGLLARDARIAYLVQSSANRTDAENQELFDWYLTQKDEAFKTAQQKLLAVQNEKEEIRRRGTIAHIMVERAEEPIAFTLHRGEYDQRRDQVKPDVPAILPPMDPALPKNRLGLAKWLMTPENPLTARVTVNRFWQEVFGTGIVRTSGDFGISGELPINQELLDWLAVDFRTNGWDVKRLFYLMLTSAAYRQSAEVTDEKLVKDADNRLLSRGPRYRMDGEMVRDYALFVSGLMTPKIGGPSVKPYQPDGVWEAVAMIGSNTRDYRRDSGENLYRRSMYTFWKRSAPPASMDIFNAPSRETCTVRRDRTNTPLQALVTLNDPQFIEAARVLAAAVLEQGSELESRLNFLSKRVLARTLTDEEKAIVRHSLDELVQHYQAQPNQAKELLKVGETAAKAELPEAELAAWTMIVNELLNLDEVLNK
jgi:mono/diheme cytochrome c family protein